VLFGHVLPEVRLALGGEVTMGAAVYGWRSSVSVVGMALELAIARPSNDVVFAVDFRALPWPGVGLFMLVEIAKATEVFHATFALVHRTTLQKMRRSR
jgi:hypothetical protein